LLSSPPEPLQHWARQVLTLLRDRGPQPMAELGEDLGVSRSKIAQEVSELERMGLVSRAGQAPSRGGRPSSMIGLSPDLHYVGVDIGATSIGVAITNGYLEVIEFIEVDADVRGGPTPIVSQTIELVNKLKTARPGVAVAAMGVGLPAPVSFRDGQPVSPPLMPGWDRYPIRDILGQKLGIPVTVDNDVNIMALGEKHTGVARGASDFLFVKVGTGIGCGIVVRGAIHRGPNGCAGDIGHIRVGDSTAPCHCGRIGCIEAEFGGAALARKARAAAQSGESPLLAQWLSERGTISAIDVGKASAAGDAAAIRLIREGGQLIGQVLAGLVNFFNPSMVVFGGGLSNLGHLLLAEIRSVIFHRSTPLATSDLSIVVSELGSQAGVIGAAFLASEKFLGPADLGAGGVRKAGAQ
jgi:glucokinase-like ROK family protein